MIRNAILFEPIFRERTNGSWASVVVVATVVAAWLLGWLGSSCIIVTKKSVASTGTTL